MRVWLPVFGVLCGVGLACTGSDSGPGNTTDARDGGGGGGSADGSVMPGTDAGGNNPNGVAPALAVSAGVRLGISASAQVEVTVVRNDYAGDVLLSVDGLPVGVTADTPTIVAGATSTLLTITTDANAPTGVASFTVKGTGGAKDAVGRLVVAGAPNTLDESFDSDGILLQPASTNALLYAVAVQPDGKIVVAGTADERWTIRRFTVAGAPDADFNTKAANGLPANGTARGIALDPKNGRIVVVGDSTPSSNAQFTVVRLNADGGKDETFANGGVLVADTVSYGQGSAGRGVVVLPDSSIVIAGLKQPNLGTIVKYTSAGNVDATFTKYLAAETSNIGAIVALPDGKLLAAGDKGLDQMAIRLESTGALDASFNGGVRLFDLGCSGVGMTLTSDGDAVIVGKHKQNPQLCTTRIAGSADGALRWSKVTFTGSGGSFFAATKATFSAAAYSAGEAGGSQDRYALIERRNVAGDVDLTHRVESDLTPDDYRVVIQGAATSSDGQVVVVGSKTVNPTGSKDRSLFVARIWE